MKWTEDTDGNLSYDGRHTQLCAETVRRIFTAFLHGVSDRDIRRTFKIKSGVLTDVRRKFRDLYVKEA